MEYFDVCLQIYVNLCCLMEEVVPLQSDISLEVHLPRLFLFFVKKSSLEPLVSTHYSVLTLFLLSARRIHYLDRPSTIVSHAWWPLENALQTHLIFAILTPDFSYQPLSSEVESIRHLLTGYISEVLQKCKQHRDHLLSSCLSLVLQMPICIVEKILAELVSPLQVGLGLNLVAECTQPAFPEVVYADTFWQSFPKGLLGIRGPQGVHRWLNDKFKNIFFLGSYKNTCALCLGFQVWELLD